MMTGDRPPLPKATARNSFHAEPGTGFANSGSKTFSKRRLTQQLSSSSASLAMNFGAPGQGVHPRHHSLSGSTTRLTASPEFAVAKEKEFMANTRILAMSNIIDTFNSTTQSKQGFYGKQLKITGTNVPTSPGSPLASGMDMDITVKLHVIDNTWTTCPLAEPSIILHRWEVMHLDSPGTSGTDHPTELACSHDRIENLSPASSPTLEHHPSRPFSTSSTSSFTGPPAGTSTTHVAILANALCFVTNVAGDYLVRLSVHVPFTTFSGCQGFHLSQLPKCQSNFIKLRIASSESKATPQDGRHEAETGACQSHEMDFNVYPPLLPLEGVHLNPDLDEDAPFWLEVQECLAKEKNNEAPNSTGSDYSETTTVSHEETETDAASQTKGYFDVVGCFTPTSSLHVSWIPKDASCLVQNVEQDMKVHISGLPKQTKSSSLLKVRKRKDPEESHTIGQQEADEGPIEYEHLEMDDADVVISTEVVLTAVVEKQGWKNPFIDMTLEHPTAERGQQSDMSLLDIVGDCVQDWERLSDPREGRRASQDLDAIAIARSQSVDSARPSSSLTYRIWFHMGTEGTISLRVNFCISQAVTVGYGRDIVCSIPRLLVHGAVRSTGRVQVSSSSDLLIQRSSSRQMETILADNPLYRDDAMVNKRQGTLQYQYSSQDYELSVVVHQYQSLSRIARIERIRAEVGVSSRRQPGFARVTLTDVVLPEQDDSYLRVYQLDGAEIWSITVDGEPCTTSVQIHDRRAGGHRTVLIPIPMNTSHEGDQQHTVELSYGFDSVNHGLHQEQGQGQEQEQEQGQGQGQGQGDDDAAESPIRLLIPGFSLPVGEYIVVANLPKLESGYEYNGPSGDFEVMSSHGSGAQRRAITFGAYMTLGRPKLLVRAQRTTTSLVPLPPTVLPPQPTPAPATVPVPQVESTEQADQQIPRNPGHPNMYAHDPQQPPFSAGPVHLQPASQRHPQQPPEPQNPHAESSGENSEMLGSGATMVAGSTVPISSPQGGGPMKQARLSFISQDTSSILSIERAMQYVWSWWKQVMVLLAAAVLVVMIINVAAFQETKNTSLTLVRFTPGWMRPFKILGQFWRDAGTTTTKKAGSFMTDDDDDNEVDDEGDLYRTLKERVVTVTQPAMVTTAADSSPTETGLELRKPEPTNAGSSSFEDDEDDTGGDSFGWKRWVRLLKGLVPGLQ
ncbi:hypothetical protein BGZ94_001405 [Podila epigama]|nr:hypothetical protein BGZ94_001405 [Podila epigama]